MNRSILLLSILFTALCGKAEILLTGGEFCTEPKCTLGNLYLEKGCEVYVLPLQDHPEWTRISFVAKIPISFFDTYDLIIKKGAILKDRNNRVIGKAYQDQEASLIDTWDSMGTKEVSVRINGYVHQLRIDPASVIENVLSRLITRWEGKVYFSQVDSLLQHYAFIQTFDTLGYQAYQMTEFTQTRITLIFLRNELVAAVPTRAFSNPFFVTSLEQQDLTIFYLKKLKQGEEEFVAQKIVGR